MTTNVIDTGFHGTSFPTTYTGAGTLVGNPRNDPAPAQGVTGYFTSNGNATEIRCGFPAQTVKVTNLTDGIVWEWQRGFGATQSIKTTLGGSFASVIDTNTQITVTGSSSDGTGGNGGVTIGATANGTSKLLCYTIRG